MNKKITRGITSVLAINRRSLLTEYIEVIFPVITKYNTTPETIKEGVKIKNSRFKSNPFGSIRSII